LIDAIHSPALTSRRRETSQKANCAVDVTNRSDFSAAEQSAVYRVIAARRDVRSDFSPRDVAEDVLMRILGAAHCAPSVGLSQPWRFIVVRDPDVRAAAHSAFKRANELAAHIYSGAQAQRYKTLRLEGILDAPVNICVLCQPTPDRGHGLGRQSMPETAYYSTICAIQNLWLAARVEGLGVGWVSIIDPADLRALFGIPTDVAVVAYLCIGYVDAFATQPDLERAGWEGRIPLSDVVDRERYGRR
jgi:5,6-dimethylbenzimidazole synthase